MAHEHCVIDGDGHFVINSVTREISNNSGKLTVIQYDHNSERFTFEVPQIVDGHDMSLCNSVQVHYLNIGTASELTAGVYDVNDLQLDSERGIVVCSWLVSGGATQHVGKLSFVLRFACVSGDSLDYAWNTTINSDITVAKSLYNTPVVAESYSDIIAGLEQRVAALEQIIAGR